jgi:hypothetical protein
MNVHADFIVIASTFSEKKLEALLLYCPLYILLKASCRILFYVSVTTSAWNYASTRVIYECNGSFGLLFWEGVKSSINLNINLKDRGINFYRR